MNESTEPLRYVSLDKEEGLRATARNALALANEHGKICLFSFENREFAVCPGAREEDVMTSTLLHTGTASTTTRVEEKTDPHDWRFVAVNEDGGPALAVVTFECSVCRVRVTVRVSPVGRFTKESCVAPLFDRFPLPARTP